MKLRPPLPRPSAADRSLLPAALTALLVAGIGALALLPISDPLPDAGVVTPLRLPPLVEASPVTDPVIVKRTLFAPARRDGGGGPAGGPGEAAAAPLGGARVAGITLSPGRARVFMVAADGTVATLGPGRLYDGWRLTGVSRTAVRFERGDERLDLTVGSVAARPAPSETEESAEESPS